MTRLAFDIAPSAVRQVQSYKAAKQETAAFVRNPIAFDSASGLYLEALRTMGVVVEPVLRSQPVALRVLFQGHRRAGTKPRQVAMDAKASADYAAMFPNANRLG